MVLFVILNQRGLFLTGGDFCGAPFSCHRCRQFAPAVEFLHRGLLMREAPSFFGEGSKSSPQQGVFFGAREGIFFGAFFEKSY